MVRTAVSGTSRPGAVAACSMRAVAKNPGLRRPLPFGTTASMVSARVSAFSDGETNRTWPVNVSPG